MQYHQQLSESLRVDLSNRASNADETNHSGNIMGIEMGCNQQYGEQ